MLARLDAQRVGGCSAKHLRRAWTQIWRLPGQAAVGQAADNGPAAGGPPRVTIEVVPRAPPRHRSLSARHHPGGLGAHKWLAAACSPRSATRPASAPDEHSSSRTVTGMSWRPTRASIFARHRRRLYTPPADGRLPAGVTRARSCASPDDA